MQMLSTPLIRQPALDRRNQILAVLFRCDSKLLIIRACLDFAAALVTAYISGFRRRRAR